MTNIQKKYGSWALVTGASSGIGKAISEQLAAQNINIVAVARSEKNLQQLKQRLEDQYRIQVMVLIADLSEPEGYNHIEQATENLDIGLLVASAGTENNGGFIDNSLQSNEQLITLNITAPMKLSHLFGRRFAARGKGGILLLSSLFAYQGVPYVANYSATKAYILSLGEALNVEFKPLGVDVTVISPGLTKTPMTDNMTVDFSKVPITRHLPEQVARIALNNLGKKATVVPGFINKFYAWENRFIPRSWPVKLFGFLIKRARTLTADETVPAQQ